jgi:hypothetical protein
MRNQSGQDEIDEINQYILVIFSIRQKMKQEVFDGQKI